MAKTMTSVRIDADVLEALERLGAEAKPVPVPARTLINLAAREYVERNDHAKRKRAK